MSFDKIDQQVNSKLKYYYLLFSPDLPRYLDNILNYNLQLHACPMKRILIFPLLLILVFTSHAQQIAVKSFRSLSNDLDARTYYPKVDRNGEKAAIIKIVTTESGFEFDAGSIGIVAQVPKTSEIWLYVPRGSKTVTIMHPKLGLLRNYVYSEPIEAGEVYEMVLTTGKVITTIEEQSIESQWLTITTEPSEADVYINDQAAGKTPYQNELPTGKYSWRLSKELYLPEAGITELLPGGEKQVIKVKLKPNYGTLSIRTEPEINGDIYINNMPASKTTPFTFEQVPAGDKTIQVKKDMYQISDQQLTLKPEQNLPVVLIAKPTFGTLSIRTEPEINGDIYINNMPAGKTTPYTFERVPAGDKTIQVKKSMYQIPDQQHILKPEQNLPVILIAKPTFGTLSISSSPESGAMVSLNGSATGKTTPCTIEKVPAGEHSITISRNEYETTTQRLTLVAGETQNVTVIMNPTFAQVTVTSSEPAADIYVNGLLKTKGLWQGRLNPGVYTFEAKLEKYNTSIEKRTVIIGQALDINLSPTPKTGNLKIMSSPFEATIKIDGKELGKTPLTLRNQLIGDYTVELSMPGYTTAYEKATITEGLTAEIIATLQNGKQVEITSNPSEADLFIDDKPNGKTPYNGNLSFGSHAIRIEKNGNKAEKEVQVSFDGTSSFQIAIITTFTEASSGLNLEMVFIKGGTINMGSSNGDTDEKPVHLVTLSDFYIGKTEVTQEQWSSVIGSDPSYFKNCDNCPVEMVSWNHIQDFLENLNRKTGKNYRLPTEAEWEYAARGGNTSKGYTFSGSNSIDDVAWFSDNSGLKTNPVSQKQPNELGISDMSGNVWEWCSDLYGTYSSGSQKNPKGRSSGSDRVIRGGSWGYKAQDNRPTNRNKCNPDYRLPFVGFRLVCVP